MDNTKICILVPYFGKLPNYFQLWLNSCKMNPRITWKLFINDETAYNFSNNVEVNYTSLSAIKDRFQLNYDFKISLESPYKLCDYRPAFGDLFRAECNGFDFWGYCDLDLIFGDIFGVLDTVLDGSYEKVFTRGHLSLIRNNLKNNQLYRSNSNYYKEVFQSENFFTFDECRIRGFNSFFYKNNLTVFDELLFADVYWGSFSLYPVQLLQKGIKQNSIFLFKNGKLFRLYFWEDNIISEEVIYVHLQKRIMSIDNDDNEYFHFLVYANEFKSIKSNLEFSQLTNLFKTRIIYWKYFRVKFKAIVDLLKTLK